ncbi:DMSO/selenate family reductase complex B subunit [uncultured Propionivibrio sp.]|uniref:DMSO/selenate family reductase complex B subunit n=1 Tax=uncultured Propionivibrio sp. TaxID=426737 RepID=UPI0037486C9A
MTQLGFFVDLSKCTGCKTCQVACKDKNNLEVGRNFRRVSEYAGGDWKEVHGAWQQDVFAYYVSIACNHCAKPACVEVCPKGALAKRADNGLVLIDQQKCIGCRDCEDACPYDAPQYNRAIRRMTKCDGCIDRISAGAQPSCVDACPQRAIEFGDVAELRRQHGSLAAVAPLADAATTLPSLVLKPSRNSRPVGDTRGTVYPPKAE